MKHKIKDWANRYIPAFIVGTAAALIFSNIARNNISNAVIVAFLGAWGATISYYLFILVRDIINRRRKTKEDISIVFLKTVRNMFVDFGVAEPLDTFVVAPFFFYMAPKFIHNFTPGILVGKICADIVFYSITITSYEIRKKIWTS